MLAYAQMNHRIVWLQTDSTCAASDKCFPSAYVVCQSVPALAIALAIQYLRRRLTDVITTFDSSDHSKQLLTKPLNKCSTLLSSLPSNTNQIKVSFVPINNKWIKYSNL